MNWSEYKGISISDDWKAAAEVIVRDAGIVMVMGGVDSGKSTLSRYLIYRLTSLNRLVAMVDCDVGQTHLGPPTTIGMMLYHNPWERFDNIRPDYMRFIGSTSPIRHLVEVVVSTRRLVDKALEMGAEVILVNTDGLIMGIPGTRLKMNQVDLLRPKYILALQESSEIEHLLTFIERQDTTSIMRLRTSEKAVKKSPETRRTFREERYREYFRGAKNTKIPLSGVTFWGYEFGDCKDLMTDETECTAKLRNLVLGLGDTENYTLALGIFQDFDAKEWCLRILTPLTSQDLGGVRHVRLGDIRIDSNGRECWIKNEQDEARDLLRRDHLSKNG